MAHSVSSVYSSHIHTLCLCVCVFVCVCVCVSVCVCVHAPLQCIHHCAALQVRGSRLSTGQKDCARARYSLQKQRKFSKSIELKVSLCVQALQYLRDVGVGWKVGWGVGDNDNDDNDNNKDNDAYVLMTHCMHTMMTSTYT